MIPKDLLHRSYGTHPVAGPQKLMANPSVPAIISQYPSAWEPVRKNAVFVSPNTANLNFSQAMTGLTSQGHQNFRGIAHQLLEKIGVKRGQLLDAIGDAEDGSENSIATLIHEPKSSRDIQYLAAWMGLMGHQKNVLAFSPDDHGNDRLHEIFVGDRDLDHLRKSLTQHAIPFRTLVPGKQGTNIFVYDQGSQLSPNVQRFADTHHATLHSTIGTGSLVGDPSWTSRSKGREAYRNIISTYEGAAGGNDSSRSAGVGKRQAPGSGAGLVSRGIFYKPGTFVPKPY